MGEMRIDAPMQGTIVSVDVSIGDPVVAGQQLMLIESMKMHHAIESPCDGAVAELLVAVGTTVMAGAAVASVMPGIVAPTEVETAARGYRSAVRPDLAEVHARHAIGLDAARPDAVERRRAVGRRTARENVADLVDEGSFVEYGPLVIAAQRRRRSVDELIERTPADGMIGGIGTVNGELFEGHAAQVIAVSYDYTVLAGTQGQQNHRKKDRLFALAESMRLPVVFFTEGGGGRPGDTDATGVSLLDGWAFLFFARLSGLVPLVGINAGYCFAGNASMLGICDVVIATEDSNIGMAGPAMIEGGGLGVVRPTEIGPTAVQQANGVIDITVADEAEGVRVAKQYLSYFQGTLRDWTCADQGDLRAAIPEDRMRSYDVRTVIDGLFDTGSVLELRRHFGLGMVTALARVEGRAVGVIANNPGHLAGAIDSDAADKAARFMQLCDSFDIPMIMLVDTPGMMVGPLARSASWPRRR
jgi:acetyl-CoA carboxylase carboxyltransferase component